MPAYKRPDRLAQTLESLLMQTRLDFAIVIVDDGPSPEVQAIVDTYRRLDDRVHYEPNPARLGMIGNWRKAFFRGRELYPDSEYFAWVSDHDVWHPRWLEVLASELDDHPGAVVAYPLMQRLFPTWRRTITRRFDTSTRTGPVARMSAALVGSGGITAGNCIYGLFRARALEQAGVFRPVLAPDRQLLMALILLGDFIHVPEILWYREVAGVFSYARQRQMFFPGRSPLHTYLPANLQHCALLFWDLGVRGKGRPHFGRFTGATYALVYLWLSTKRELIKKDAGWRVMLDRSPFSGWLKKRPNEPQEPVTASAGGRDADPA
jgi:glycosyltransferase involved in cell wall biosynthesis